MHATTVSDDEDDISDASGSDSIRTRQKRGNRYIGRTIEEIDDDDDLPYAQLIYKALMSVPDRQMILGEIYKYFQEKMPRFRNMQSKGWQNSIRHNLSMNGVCRPHDLCFRGPFS